MQRRRAGIDAHHGPIAADEIGQLALELFHQRPHPQTAVADHLGHRLHLAVAHGRFR
jgi:hypothetical protein